VTIGRERKVAMWIVALFMGFFSGALVTMIVAATRANPRWDDTLSPSAVAMVFLIGWGFSLWVLLRKADGVLTVMQRGFLLGVGEWIVIGVIAVTLGPRGVASSDTGLMMEGASWEPARGGQSASAAVSAFTGSAFVFLATLCLLGWALAFIAARSHQRRRLRNAAPSDAAHAAGAPTPLGARAR
jgi:hypothetical protein